MSYTNWLSAAVAVSLALGCSGDATSSDAVDERAMSEEQDSSGADDDPSGEDTTNSARSDDSESKATSSERSDDDGSSSASSPETSTEMTDDGGDSAANSASDDDNDATSDPATDDDRDSSTVSSDERPPSDSASDTSLDEDLADSDAQDETMSPAVDDEMSIDPATGPESGEELSPFGFVPLTESPGSVRLELDIEEGAFCDMTDCGLGRRHIVIFDEEAGAVLVGVGRSDCATPCDTCELPACPGFSCNEPEPYELADEAFVWDGSFIEQSTCGESLGCERSHYAPPGRYFAQVCATPGTVSDGTCQSAQVECVTFEFDFPGDTHSAELTAP